MILSTRIIVVEKEGMVFFRSSRVDFNTEKNMKSASRRAKLEFTIDYDSNEDASNTYKGLIEDLPGWF